MEKITQEDLQFLKELAHELKTQDNRCTANPFHAIKTTERIYGASNGYSDGAVVMSDGETYAESIEELKDNWLELSKDWEDYPEIDGFESREEFNQLVGDIHSLENWFDVESFINAYDEKFSDFEVVEYFEYQKLQNVFLTEKACKKHIELNSYHYNEPIDYVDCAWRNPEFDRLIEIIKKFD